MLWVSDSARGHAVASPVSGSTITTVFIAHPTQTPTPTPQVPPRPVCSAS